MPYTLTYSFNAPPGSTLEVAVLDTSNVIVGTPITTGFVEIGGGCYGWTGSIPDGHRGFVSIRPSGGGAPYMVFAVNPEEGEYIDAKNSAPKDVNLTQVVPIADLSEKTTQDIGDCLSAARADAAGRLEIVDDNLLIYGPNNTVVRQFVLDNPVSPTTRQ